MKAVGGDYQKETEIEFDVMKNILYKLMPLLASIGSQMHIIGEAKECEEAYGFYVATMESLLGQNTRPLSELYFWLGIYYFKNLYHLEKARICFQKAFLILDEYKETDRDEHLLRTAETQRDLLRMAEIHINVASVLKAQLKYVDSISEFERAIAIYEQVSGRGSLAYLTCAFEIAQVKFI